MPITLYSVLMEYLKPPELIGHIETATWGTCGHETPGTIVFMEHLEPLVLMGHLEPPLIMRHLEPPVWVRWAGLSSYG